MENGAIGNSQMQFTNTSDLKESTFNCSSRKEPARYNSPTTNYWCATVDDYFAVYFLQPTILSGFVFELISCSNCLPFSLKLLHYHTNPSETLVYSENNDPNYKLAVENGRRFYLKENIFLTYLKFEIHEGNLVGRFELFGCSQWTNAKPIGWSTSYKKEVRSLTPYRNGASFNSYVSRLNTAMFDGWLPDLQAHANHQTVYQSKVFVEIFFPKTTLTHMEIQQHFEEIYHNYFDIFVKYYSSRWIKYGQGKTTHPKEIDLSFCKESDKVVKYVFASALKGATRLRVHPIYTKVTLPRFKFELFGYPEILPFHHWLPDGSWDDQVGVNDFSNTKPSTSIMPLTEFKDYSLNFWLKQRSYPNQPSLLVASPTLQTRFYSDCHPYNGNLAFTTGIYFKSLLVHEQFNQVSRVSLSVGPFKYISDAFTQKSFNVKFFVGVEENFIQDCHYGGLEIPNKDTDVLVNAIKQGDGTYLYFDITSTFTELFVSTEWSYGDSLAIVFLPIATTLSTQSTLPKWSLKFSIIKACGDFRENIIAEVDDSQFKFTTANPCDLHPENIKFSKLEDILTCDTIEITVTLPHHFYITMIRAGGTKLDGYVNAFTLLYSVNCVDFHKYAPDFTKTVWHAENFALKSPIYAKCLKLAVLSQIGSSNSLKFDVISCDYGIQKLDEIYNRIVIGDNMLYVGSDSGVYKLLSENSKPELLFKPQSSNYTMKWDNKKLIYIDNNHLNEYTDSGGPTSTEIICVDSTSDGKGTVYRIIEDGGKVQMENSELHTNSMLTITNMKLKRASVLESEGRIYVIATNNKLQYLNLPFVAGYYNEIYAMPRNCLQVKALESGVWCLTTDDGLDVYINDQWKTFAPHGSCKAFDVDENNVLCIDNRNKIAKYRTRFELSPLIIPVLSTGYQEVGGRISGIGLSVAQQFYSLEKSLFNLIVKSHTGSRRYEMKVSKDLLFNKWYNIHITFERGSLSVHIDNEMESWPVEGIEGTSTEVKWRTGMIVGHYYEQHRQYSKSTYIEDIRFYKIPIQPPEIEFEDFDNLKLGRYDGYSITTSCGRKNACHKRGTEEVVFMSYDCLSYHNAQLSCYLTGGLLVLQSLSQSKLRNIVGGHPQCAENPDKVLMGVYEGKWTNTQREIDTTDMVGKADSCAAMISTGTDKGKWTSTSCDVPTAYACQNLALLYKKVLEPIQQPPEAPQCQFENAMYKLVWFPLQDICRELEGRYIKRVLLKSRIEALIVQEVQITVFSQQCGVLSQNNEHITWDIGMEKSFPWIASPNLADMVAMFMEINPCQPLPLLIYWNEGDATSLFNDLTLHFVYYISNPFLKFDTRLNTKKLPPPHYQLALLSPFVNKVTFQFGMLGMDSGTLLVWLIPWIVTSPKLVFVAKGKQSKTWNTAVIDIAEYRKMTKSKKILFVAIRGDNFGENTIAIDDIKLETTPEGFTSNEKPDLPYQSNDLTMKEEFFTDHLDVPLPFILHPFHQSLLWDFVNHEPSKHEYVNDKFGFPLSSIKARNSMKSAVEVVWNGTTYSYLFHLQLSPTPSYIKVINYATFAIVVDQFELKFLTMETISDSTGSFSAFYPKHINCDIKFESERWYFIAVLFGDHKFQVFIDNQLKSEGSITLPDTHSSALYLFNSLLDTNNSYIMLSCLQIYKEKLSLTQIKTLELCPHLNNKVLCPHKCMDGGYCSPFKNHCQCPHRHHVYFDKVTCALEMKTRLVHQAADFHLDFDSPGWIEQDKYGSLVRSPVNFGRCTTETTVIESGPVCANSNCPTYAFSVWLKINTEVTDIISFRHILIAGASSKGYFEAVYGGTKCKIKSYYNLNKWFYVYVKRTPESIYFKLNEMTRLTECAFPTTVRDFVEQPLTIGAYVCYDELTYFSSVIFPPFYSVFRAMKIDSYVGMSSSLHEYTGSSTSFDILETFTSIPTDYSVTFDIKIHKGDRKYLVKFTTDGVAWFRIYMYETLPDFVYVESLKCKCTVRHRIEQAITYHWQISQESGRFSVKIRKHGEEQIYLIISKNWYSLGSEIVLFERNEVLTYSRDLHINVDNPAYFGNSLLIDKNTYSITFDQTRKPQSAVWGGLFALEPRNGGHHPEMSIHPGGVALTVIRERPHLLDQTDGYQRVTINQRTIDGQIHAWVYLNRILTSRTVFTPNSETAQVDVKITSKVTVRNFALYANDNVHVIKQTAISNRELFLPKMDIRLSSSDYVTSEDLMRKDTIHFTYVQIEFINAATELFQNVSQDIIFKDLNQTSTPEALTTAHLQVQLSGYVNLTSSKELPLHGTEVLFQSRTYYLAYTFSSQIASIKPEVESYDATTLKLYISNHKVFDTYIYHKGFYLTKTQRNVVTGDVFSTTSQTRSSLNGYIFLEGALVGYRLYEFTVVSLFHQGFGGAEGSLQYLSLSTICNIAPTINNTSALELNQLTITWSFNELENTSPNLTYRVYFVDVSKYDNNEPSYYNNNTNFTDFVDVSNKNATIEGLKSYRYFMLAVAVKNDVGIGPYNTIIARTLPSAPDVLRNMSITHSTTTLSITAPSLPISSINAERMLLYMAKITSYFNYEALKTTCMAWKASIPWLSSTPYFTFQNTTCRPKQVVKISLFSLNEVGRSPSLEACFITREDVTFTDESGEDKVSVVSVVNIHHPGSVEPFAAINITFGSIHPWAEYFIVTHYKLVVYGQSDHIIDIEHDPNNIRLWNTTDHFNCSLASELNSTSPNVTYTVRDLYYNFDYTFDVFACGTQGCSGQSLSVDVRTSQNYPTCASEINFQNTTVDSFTLNFTTINKTCLNGDLISYAIVYYDTLMYENRSTTSNLTELKTFANLFYTPSEHIVVEGLKSYWNYSYRVFVVNNIGDGVLSPLYFFRTNQSAPSAPPQNFRVHLKGTTIIELLWNKIPHEQQNGVIVEYHIYGSDYENEIPPDDFPHELPSHVYNYTIAALPFRNYFFEICGCNIAGCSPRLNISFKSKAIAPLSAPSFLLPTGTSSSSMLVNWTAIPATDVFGVLHYQVHYQVIGYVFYAKPNSSLSGMKNVSSLWTYLDDLAYFTNYSIAVCGCTTECGPCIRRFERTAVFAHGGWSEWTEWGACDVSCGLGGQQRVRWCANPKPEGGGMDCQGEAMQRKQCNHFPCVGYYLGEALTSCRETCNKHDFKCASGMNTANINFNKLLNPSNYTITINITCAHGVNNNSLYTHPYDPHVKMLESCNGYRNLPANLSCNVTSNDPLIRRVCHCIDSATAMFSTWGNWGLACSKDCGVGVRTRYRECLLSTGCPASSDVDQQNCNTQPCPVHGEWGSWSAFTECFVTCGLGHRLRRRKCDNPSPMFGGRACEGPSFDFLTGCNPYPCPVHGGWSSWSSREECTQPCGSMGVRTERRRCDSPPPSLGGKQCPGPDTQHLKCEYNRPCPAINVDFIVRFTEESWDFHMYQINSPAARNINNKIMKNIKDAYLEVGSQITDVLKFTFKRLQRGSVIASFRLTYPHVSNQELLYLQHLLDHTNRVVDMPVQLLNINSLQVPTSAPQNITIEAMSATNLLVSWSAIEHQSTVNGPFYLYYVFYRKADTNDTFENKGTKLLSLLLTGLDVGTVYAIRVLVANEYGNGVASKELRYITKESAPLIAPPDTWYQITAYDTVYFNWDFIPAQYVPGKLIGYNVTLHKYSGEKRITNIEFSNYFSTVFKGLEGAQMYMAHVAAFTSAGLGPSHVFVFTMPEGPPSVAAPFTTATNNKHWSRITLHWDFIPRHLENGRLLGYQIRYKKTSQSDVDMAAEEWLEVTCDRYTKSLTISSLENYAQYVFNVRGFTAAGYGPHVSVTGETCRCPGHIFTNWKDSGELVYKDDNDVVKGFFPEILSDALKTICTPCEAYQQVQVHFHATSDGHHAEKQTRVAFRQAVDDTTHLSFPFSQRSSVYSRYPFVPLLPSSGSAVLVHRPKVVSIGLMKILTSIFSAWSLILTLLIFAFTCGLVLWFAEQCTNSGDINKKSILHGLFQGFWFTIITLSTVGYGDFTVNSKVGRLVTIVWILIGLLMTSLFVGQVTFSMYINKIPNNVQLYSQKVAVLKDSREEQLAIRRNAIIEKEYKSIDEVIDAVSRMEVEVGLMDVSHILRIQQNISEKNVAVDRVLHVGNSYGIVLTAHMVALENDIRSYISTNQVQLYDYIQMLKGGVEMQNVMTKVVLFSNKEALEMYKMLAIAFACLYFTLLFVWLLLKCYQRKKRICSYEIDNLYNSFRTAIDVKRLLDEITASLEQSFKRDEEEILELFFLRRNLEKYYNLQKMQKLKNIDIIYGKR